jgi:hypothetical protein
VKSYPEKMDRFKADDAAKLGRNFWRCDAAAATLGSWEAS